MKITLHKKEFSSVVFRFEKTAENGGFFCDL